MPTLDAILSEPNQTENSIVGKIKNPSLFRRISNYLRRTHSNLTLTNKYREPAVRIAASILLLAAPLVEKLKAATPYVNLEQSIRAAIMNPIMNHFTITNCQAKYGGGIGEPNDPYRIITPEDLNDIGNHEEDWDKHFILVNDVDLAQYTGTQFKIIGGLIWWGDPNDRPFTGVFDGNDHKVWNFTWASDGKDGIGLFRYVGAGGQIINLGMENVNINAQMSVGGLVAYNKGGTITNCYSTGTIKGYATVGGLIGSSHEGTITNCYSTGSVLGTGTTGGLVGYSWGDIITNCYFIGSVGRGDARIGGLVGQNNSMITKCYSTGSVGGDEQVGGLIGNNSGPITNCYSTGSVLAGYEAGGLVGLNKGMIMNCYSSANVSATGDDVGGLVGYDVGEVVVNSFWDIETSSQLTSAGGEPKTTAEMKTIDTFVDADWDFVEVWGIGEHQTYPYLKFAPAGDLNHDKKVNLVDLAILASHWLEGVE